jgi:hypothetical protein
MTKKFVVNDEGWAQVLEKGVEDYTDMLFEAVWDGTEDEIPETLSGRTILWLWHLFLERGIVLLSTSFDRRLRGRQNRT